MIHSNRVAIRLLLLLLLIIINGIIEMPFTLLDSHNVTNKITTKIQHETNSG